MTRACSGTVTSCCTVTKACVARLPRRFAIAYRPTPCTYSERVAVAVSPAAAAAAVSPTAAAVSPAASATAAEEHESQEPHGSGGDTPTSHPFSKDYVPQNPCGSLVCVPRQLPQLVLPLLRRSHLWAKEGGEAGVSRADLAKVLCNLAQLLSHDAGVAPRRRGRQAGVHALGR